MKIVSSFDNGLFSWEPNASKSGYLVISLPPEHQYTSLNTKLVISGSFGTEEGFYAGRINGNRMTYIFSHPGKFYDSNIKATFTSPAEKVTWIIKNGETRTVL